MTTNMAGRSEDSGSELVDLAAVRRQIDGFDAEDDELSEESHYENDPSGDLEQQCSHYKRQIQKVQTEIKDLEWKIKQLQGTDKLAELPPRFVQKGKKKRKLSDVEDEINVMKHCISLTEELTSVHVQSSTWKTVYQDGNMLCRKNQVHGQVGEIAFVLEYKVLEPFGLEAENVVPKIISVVLEVPEDIPDSFTNILQKIVQVNEIQGVFTALSSYSLWKQKYDQTLQELQTAHSRYLMEKEVEAAECLMISDFQSPEKRAITVIIKWDLSLSPTFGVEAVPVIAVEVPEKMLHLDADNTIENLGKNFPRLQKRLGLKKSLEFLISVIKRM